MSTPVNPLFGRKWEIQLLPPGSNGQQDVTTVSSSDFEQALRVRFEVYQPGYAAFWFGDIEIWNLDEQTEKAFLSLGERTRVIISAGYENGAYGPIFEGYVFQPLWDRENVTDFKVTLRCVTGRLELSQNFVWFTSGPGASQTDIVRRMASAAHNQFEIAVMSDKLKKTTLPRGVTVFGAPTKYLDQVAADNNMQWWMSEAGLNLGSLMEVPPNEALVVTPETGLVGTPQQTDNGVMFRTLLDPRLKVKINPAMQVKLDLTTIRQLKKAPGDYPSVLDRDGFYNVGSVRHLGDTRGQEWFTEVIGYTTAQGTLAAMMTTGNENVNGGQ